MPLLIKVSKGDR